MKKAAWIAIPCVAVLLGSAVLDSGPRAAAVVGAFDIPPVVPASGGYEGVVRLSLHEKEEDSIGTGTLLADGRHILTAAHNFTDDQGKLDVTGTTVHFDLRGGGKDYTVPAKDIILHPRWNGKVDDGFDLAIVRLPEVARGSTGPVRGFRLYTGNDEVGQKFNFLGYGNLGTGTSGEVAGGTSLQRLIIAGATRGQFQLDFNGRKEHVPFDVSADALQKAVRTLTDSDQVKVFQVDNTRKGERVFEIVFDGVDADDFPSEEVPLLQARNGPGSDGKVTTAILLNGAEEGKRQAVNTFLKTDRDDMLKAALNPVKGQGVLGRGDSGGPAFIGERIAGVASNGDGESQFGDEAEWVRVSSHKDWIEKTVRGR